MVLEVFCSAVAMQRQAQAELSRVTLASVEAKRLQVLLSKASMAIVRTSVELGFTPASRPRLRVENGKWNGGAIAATNDDGSPRLSLEEFLIQGQLLRSSH